MRHGMITVLAAGLLAAIAGCKPKPQNKRMTVEQTPPFRTEEEFAADAEATDPETAPVDLVAADAGTKDGAENANAAVSEGPTKPKTRTYVVKRGDKGFMDIARKQLGDVHRWRQIRDLNPGVDTRKLRIGQEIKIPAE